PRQAYRSTHSSTAQRSGSDARSTASRKSDRASRGDPNNPRERRLERSVSTNRNHALTGLANSPPAGSCCNLPRYRAQSRRFDSRRWQTRYPPRTFALHSGLKRKLSGKASLSQEEAKTTLFPGYPRRVKIVTGSHAKDPAFAHSTVRVYDYRNEKAS